MKKKNIIICGFGFMGQTHAANILKSSNARLAGVVTRTAREAVKPVAGNVDTAAFDWRLLDDVPFFSNLSDAFKNCDFDAAVVAAPTALHAEFAREMLQHGKDIFLEKPLCSGFAEAQELIALAEQSQRVFHIGHCLRFLVEYRFLSSVYAGKKYGKLKYLKLIRRTGVPNWGTWKDKDTTLGSITGPVFDLNIHDVDFAIKLLGEPENITAVKEEYSSKLFKAYWQNNAGTAVELEGGFAEQSSYPFRCGYTAVFEDAVLEYNSQSTQTLQLSDNEKSEPVVLTAQDAYALEMESFIQELYGRESVHCSVKEAAQAVKVCQQIIDLL